MASAADGTGIPWQAPTLHVILASTLMGVMGVSLISPALPAVRTGLGITEAEASLLISAFTLPGILMGPAAGMLADRYGRRPVLIPALILYGLSGGAVVLAPDIWTAVGLRAIQGTAAAGLITLAITLVGDLWHGADRNTIMGLNGAVLSIGTAAYPLVGGALSTVDWRAPFAIYLLGVPVGFFAMRVLPEPDIERQPGGLGYLRGAVTALPPMPAVLLYGTALFIFVLLYGGVLTALPFLLDAELGLSAIRIGLVLTTASFATALASYNNGRLVRRFSNAAIIAAGVACLGLGLLGLWAASTGLASAGAILFFGAGMGLTMPSLDTAVSQLVPGRYRGGAMSLRTSMVRLGQTIGPALFTGVAVVYGYRIQLLGFGAAAVVLGLLGLVLIERAQRPRQEEAER